MSISKQYTKEMKERLNYSATWLPTTVVEPGDVGTIANFQFQHLTTLESLEIDFETIPNPVQMAFDYCSANSVSICTKVSGQVPIIGSSLSQADAGISVKFSRNKAIVCRLTNCSSTRIADLNSLRKQVLPKSKTKEWRAEMVVVTEAVKAACATIIISDSSNSQIDLLARGSVGPNELNLTNVNADLQVLRTSNIAFHIVAKRDLTPLFRFAGIKKHFLSPSELGLKTIKKQRTNFAILDYGDFEP